MSRLKAYRDRLFVKGLCRMCAKPREDLELQECAACRKKRNARTAHLWRTSEAYREKLRARRRAHRSRERQKQIASVLEGRRR